MPNWKLVNKTYLYDGTLHGFLTIVFNCYVSQTLPQKIASNAEYIPNFLDSPIKIETNFEKSERVFCRHRKKPWLYYPLFYLLCFSF